MLLLLLLLLLLFVVFVLLLLIGAVTLIELFIDAGGKFPPPTPGIDRPAKKPVEKHNIVNEFAQRTGKYSIELNGGVFTTLIS